MLDPDMVIVTGGLAEQPILIQKIREAMPKVLQGGMSFKGFDLSQMSGVGMDMNDFMVDFVKGELCLDANLYGALYCINQLLEA